MILFRKISSIRPVVDFLTTQLQDALRTQSSVVWLLAGGSCIPVAVAVSKRLQGQDLRRLNVSLTDERFGEVGHSDANWQALVAAGFELPGAILMPVLIGRSLDETTKAYDQHMTTILQSSAYKLGLFGVGADGHTAGILPASSAVPAAGMAVSFKGPDFVRLTITPRAIAQLDMAVIYAVGEAKWPVLASLGTDVQLEVQPAQALKSARSAIVFNDYEGEKV